MASRLENWQLDERFFVLELKQGLGLRGLSATVSGRVSFLEVVDEVAAGSVGAESGRVVGSAQIRLVLGVPGDAAEFLVAVSELALFSVFACPVFLKRTAEFGLVSAGIDRLGASSRARARRRRRVAVEAEPVSSSAQRSWNIEPRAARRR